MNIPKEALDAASERLLGTADSPTGWLSDLGAHVDPKNGLVWAQDPGAIDVRHTVKDVLEAALPYIEAALRKQIANDPGYYAITYISGSTWNNALYHVTEQAARIAEEGKPMTNEPNVVYESRKPRYIVRENGAPESGHHTLADARGEADRLQEVFPYNTYDVIDTRPGEPEPTQIF